MAPTSTQPRRPPATQMRLITVLVCVLIGVLVAVSARFEHTGQGQPSRGGLVDAYRSEQKQLRQANERAQLLRAHVQTQASQVAQKAGQKTSPEQEKREKILSEQAGMEPAQGAGLTVVLNDAPAGSYERLGSLDSNPDDFVVHQQDVQGVVNALWAGGAHAMMLQDQRVISTSAVRCVGSVLLLQDRSYPPPYTIKAIGPVDQLQNALNSSPSVTLYRQYADRLGLEYTVTYDPALHLPAYEGSTGIAQAQVVTSG